MIFENFGHSNMYCCDNERYVELSVDERAYSNVCAAVSVVGMIDIRKTSMLISMLASI